MLRSETHETIEEALDAAEEILSAVFETEYRRTQSPVHYSQVEMGSWWFDFSTEGVDYRFIIHLHDGNFKLMELDDELAIIESR